MHAASRTFLFTLAVILIAGSRLAFPQNQPAKPRVDALGDPLPAGAVMRLGTARFQVSGFPHSFAANARLMPYLPVSLEGGKRLLLFHENFRPENLGDEYRWIDAVTGKVLEAWPLPKGHKPVGVSPDGKLALLCSMPFIGKSAFAFHLYDLDRKQEVKDFTGNFSGMDSPNNLVCCFSTDRKWIATAEWFQGNGIFSPVTRLWDVTSGKQVWVDRRAEYGNVLLGFTPDNGRLVLFDRAASSIKVIDVSQAKNVKSFELEERALAECLSPDGKVVLCTGDKQIAIWDIQSGKKIDAFDWNARVLTFTPDGKTLVAGSYRNEGALAELRDWPSGKVRQTINLLTGPLPVTNLTVSADGRTLNVLFEYQQRLCRFNLQTGQPLPLPAESHTFSAVSVAVAPDGTVLSLGSIFPGTNNKELLAWDLATGKLKPQVHPQPGTPLPGIPVSPDGKRSVAREDNSLIVFDRDSGKILHRFGPVDQRGRVVFSPDGQLIAAGGVAEWRRVSVWETGTGKLAAEFSSHGYHSPLFSPDGQYLLPRDQFGIEFWSVKDWKVAKRVRALLPPLDFTPDSRMLVSAVFYAHAENAITFVEVATGQVRAAYALPQDGSVRLRYLSPDGNHLAGVGPKGTIVIWDIIQGKQVAAFDSHESRCAEGDDDRYTSLAFTRDGKRLISANSDGTLLVWDVAGAIPKQRAAAKFTDKEVQTAWDDLAASNAEKAFTSIRALCARPEQSVAAIGPRLQPAGPFDAAKVRLLLTDLDSPTFVDRQRASKSLEAFDNRADKELKAFLAAKPSVEAQRRAEAAFAVIAQRGLQELRALEVLEHVGTDAARAELKRLAGGALDASLTREAAAALKRLDKR